MKILKISALFILLVKPVFALEPGWQIAGQMPMPIAGGEAVVYNNLIYILGGFSDSLQAPVDWIYSFDPINRSWHYESAMDFPRVNFISAVYNDSLYYCGGIPQSPMHNDRIAKWNFQPNGPPITIFNHPSINRLFASGVVSGNSLYLIGGLLFGFSSFITEFDLSNSIIKTQFHNSSIFNEIPIGLMTAAYQNDIYIFGGVTFGISPKIYKIGTNLEFIEEITLPMINPRAQGRAISIQSDNMIIIIGGQNENHDALSSTEILSITNDGYAIEAGPSLNIARANLMSVLYENKIYVFGGYDENGNVVPEIEVLSINELTSVENEMSVIDGYELKQNYPNPFNPSTTIEFTAGKEGIVKLEIYSVTGELVKTLINDFYRPGNYSAVWNGKDQFGSQVSSGVYIYKLGTANFHLNKSMILLK